MKLKEIPASLARRFALARLDARALHDPGRPRVPVIVSLTSIPRRLNALHWTVRSVLAQTRAPERMILWLDGELRDKLPGTLSCLLGDRFEVRFVTGTEPHRKLVHSLRAFPDTVLVTCDDDVMYAPAWLEKLYEEHLRHPRAIIANECRRISYDQDGSLKPYRDWPFETRPGASYDALMSVGYGGVLYPPRSLHPDVTDQGLYLRLAPRADDLWFKAMALRQGTPVRRAWDPSPRPTPVYFSQTSSLKTANVKQDGNRLQWQALADHYQFRLRPE